MSDNIAASRLASERKSWRKDHPYGASAKPRTKADGSVDLFIWDITFPGKGDYDGATIPLTIFFSKDFPAIAPIVRLPRGFIHPNVFDDGSICLSIIGNQWKPSITLKEIVLGVQELLVTPNEKDPANWDANDMYLHHSEEYKSTVDHQRHRYMTDID